MVWCGVVWRGVAWLVWCGVVCFEVDEYGACLVGTGGGATAAALSVLGRARDARVVVVVMAVALGGDCGSK